MNSDRTKLLTRYLLVITLQSKSWGLLLFSPCNFLLKVVSFYFIFFTAKRDRVFDLLFFFVCVTFSWKWATILHFLLLQNVLNPFTDKFISLWLFHYCRLLVTAFLLLAMRTGPVLTSLQEMQWREYTAQLSFHRIQSIKPCWFELVEVLDHSLWNKPSLWPERFQAYYFTWVVSPENEPSLSIFEGSV